MELKEIAQGLAERFGMGGLAVENGEAAMEIDGMPVLLAENGNGAIVVTGFVGESPAEGGEAFANLMLEATTGFMDRKARALARNPETGAYSLVQRVSQDGLTMDSFCDELSDFANTLESWRGMLEGFRPVAAAAKEMADAEPNAAEMALGGFMQV